MKFYRSIAFFLPAVIVLTVLLGGLGAIGYSLGLKQQEFIDDTKHSMRIRSDQLVRMSEALMISQPGLLEEELMFIAATLSAQALVLTAPDGQVLFAHDSLWKGEAVEQFLPELDAPHLQRLAQHFGIELEYQPDEQRVTLLAPFDFPNRPDRIDSQEVGFIYLVVDLGDDWVRERQRELWRLLPLLLLVVLAAVGLSLWLHHRLVRPIRKLALAPVKSVIWPRTWLSWRSGCRSNRASWSRTSPWSRRSSSRPPRRSSWPTPRACG